MPTAVSNRLRSDDKSLVKLKLVHPHLEYCSAFVQNNDNTDSNYHDGFDDFLQCLRTNTHVQYVLVERGFARDLSTEQLIAVFQALGQMTQLQEVEIWSLRVPFTELCQAFQSTPVQRLGFGFVSLMGDTLDASALQGHATLQDFCLSDFRFSNENSSLDSLLEALSTCPRLRQVEMFQYQQEQPPVTAHGLRVILQSSSLTHLTLRRMRLTSDSTQEMAKALAHNQQLRVLNLNDNKLGDEGCLAIGNALTSSNKSKLRDLNLRKNELTDMGCFELATHYLSANHGLEKLNLACNPIMDRGALGLQQLLEVHPNLQTLELHRTQLTDTGCRRLVKSLPKNSTLLRLDLSFNNITEQTYLAVAAALMHNDTLKSINLQVNHTMKTVQAATALLHMVQVNTCLENISTLMRVRFEPQDYHMVESLLNQINLYLRLNHAGRHHLLLGNASPADWGSSLLSLQDDLNGLYYLMQANPSLCSYMLSNTTTATVDSELNNTLGVAL